MAPTPSRNPIRYCFKLVFPDGRWSIDEKQLAAAPREGDVIEFDGYGGWRIQGSQRVGVKPAGKAAARVLRLRSRRLDPRNVSVSRQTD